MKVRPILGALMLMILTAGAALAWPEGPPDKVTISGPGIKGTIEVTDKTSLEGLGPEQFMDLSEPVDAPSPGATPYEVVRYIKGIGDTGEFDRLRYYPSQGSSPGYIYYAEAIGYRPSYTAGKWFQATPQGDAAMKRLLARYTSTSGTLAMATRVEAASSKAGRLCASGSTSAKAY